MTNNQSNDLDDDELFWKLEDFDLPAKDEPEAASKTEELEQPFAQPLGAHPVSHTKEVAGSSEHIPSTPPSRAPSSATELPELGDFPEDFSSPPSSSSDDSDELGSIDDTAESIIASQPSGNEVTAPESTEDHLVTIDSIDNNATPEVSNQQQTTSSQPKDKIALLAFAALLLSAITAFVTYFINSTDFDDKYSWKQTLPSDGKLVKVASVDTYWQKAKGPDVKLGVEYIPVIKINISEKSSDSALRIAFRNYDGKSVGDPKIEVIKDGKFDNGKTEKEVYCTDGLLDEAKLRGYLAQNEVRWTVHLTESAVARSSLTEENKVGSTSISPNFIEN